MKLAGGHVAYCKQCLSLVNLVEGLVFTQKKRLSLLFRMVLKSKCQMLLDYLKNLRLCTFCSALDLEMCIG